MNVRPERDDREVMGTCPECRAGQHHKCDTTAWDEIEDEPTACACWVRNHDRKERLR